MRNVDPHDQTTMLLPVQRVSSPKSLDWIPSGIRDIWGYRLPIPWREDERRLEECEKQPRHLDKTTTTLKLENSKHSPLTFAPSAEDNLHYTTTGQH